MFHSRMSRSIAAPPRAVWEVVSDPATWHIWGPIIADVDYDGERLRQGSRGEVLLIPGIWVPFEITSLRNLPDAQWTWRVGHLPGASHRVRADPKRRGHTEVSFAHPGWFPGYLAGTWLALRQLEQAVLGG